MKVLARNSALFESSGRNLKICVHILGTARTEYRLMRNAVTLLQAGYAVSIVDIEADCTRPTQEEVQGIQINHIMMPSWFIPTRFKPWFLVKLLYAIILGFVKLLQTDADAYQAYVEKALPACYFVALLRHKPLIFEAPELPLSDPHVTRWRILTTISNLVLALMMRRCMGVITVSSAIVEEMYRRYNPRKVILLRNIPFYKNVKKGQNIRQYLCLSAETRIALYQGNIQRDRGLDRLVLAAPFLEKDIVIVLMGKNEDMTYNRLKTLIANKGVADRVKIIPPVPQEELLDWTASADIGLNIFSPYYSLNARWMLPNKLFEYLMAGLPVLASRLDLVEEVITTYKVGCIVSSLAPVDIAMAINTMLSDSDALATMRFNALEVAKKEFYWENESIKLIQLYKSMFLPSN